MSTVGSGSWHRGVSPGLAPSFDTSRPHMGVNFNADMFFQGVIGVFGDGYDFLDPAAQSCPEALD